MRCSQTRLTALRRTGVNLAIDLSTYDRKSRDFRARVAILAQNNVRDGAQMTGDPLNLWLTQESSQDFDTDLPQVAQDILACPATSVPSQRLFSISGILSDDRKSRILPSNLEKRILIKANR